MAGKTRRDPKGRVLHKGETYKKKQQLYCFRYTDPFGERKCIYAKDLPELRKKEDLFERDRLDGLDVYVMEKSDVNFVFDRYMETKKDLRSTTFTNYLYMYNKFVRDGFGKQKITDIRYSDVLKFYIALLDKGLQVNTVETVHTVLHPTFQLAVKDRIIPSNPTDGAMKELKKSTSKHSSIKHALTLEQEKAFLEYVEKTPGMQRWYPLFVVMFGTGCRIGEVIGLRWQDIDYDKRTININHSLTYYPRHDKSYKCETKVSLPKTEAGIRIVPMLDKVKKAFEQERLFQDETGERCLAVIDGMDDFIFCNRFGLTHNPAAINRAIKRIVDAYNRDEVVRAKRERREPVILPRFSSHIARHTFCSRLCENEVNVKAIQEIMGHKDIQTTLDIYAEISERVKKDVVFKLDETGLL